MTLSRSKFDILQAMEEAGGILNSEKIAKRTGMPEETVKSTVQELTEEGLVLEGKITDKGIEALEPYRVKRAVFIAAGFGSRLVPITINTPKPLVRVHGIRIIDRLIDACLENGIDEIYIVRGYLAEQFDQLLYKYPMIKFLENPTFNEANNIASSLIAGDLLSNAYVFEADLLISNPKIIKKYNYISNFLAIWKDKTDDWCFDVKDNVIIEEKVGGENCWQMVGISYWDDEAGRNLKKDIASVFASPGGKDRYWEQVPLVFCKENYTVEVRECFDEDIVEIDTFDELKALDDAYNV